MCSQSCPRKTEDPDLREGRVKRLHTGVGISVEMGKKGCIKTCGFLSPGFVCHYCLNINIYFHHSPLCERKTLTKYQACCSVRSSGVQRFSIALSQALGYPVGPTAGPQTWGSWCPGPRKQAVRAAWPGRDCHLSNLACDLSSNL